MNIYNAIMKAADKIDLEPSSFQFMRVTVPGSCGSPACALGWIGFYASRLAGTSVGDVSQHLLGVHSEKFYDRMRAIHKARCGTLYWRDTPKDVATNLRLYAAKYHAPDAKDDGDAFKRFLTAALSQPETCSAQRSAS